jgi:cytoskeletal protein RodZ
MRGLRRAGKRRRIVCRERTVKPQERDELTKHRKLEAINDRLAQHDRKIQVTLLLVVVLNVVLLAVLVYQFLGRD